MGKYLINTFLNIKLFPAQILILNAESKSGKKYPAIFSNIDNLVVTNIYGCKINALYKPHRNDFVSSSYSDREESICCNEFSIAHRGNGTIKKKIPMTVSTFKDSFGNLSYTTNNQIL